MIEITQTEAQARIEKLKKTINRHRYLYHVLDRSEISPAALDSLKRELVELENRFPGLKTDDSPSQRLAGGILPGLKKIKHAIAQWSFDDAFTVTDLETFATRVTRILGDRPAYVGELKIDGFKIVLTYNRGILKTAATRGDGIAGEDVTANVKLIESIPLRLERPVSLVVEGEIWLGKKEFARLNQQQSRKKEPLFANPRNLAAGTIRQLDPKIVASRELDSFIYDLVKADFVRPPTQLAELKLLRSLGFKVNKHFIKTKDIGTIIEYWQKWQTKKETENYWVDGVVVKVNDLRQQEKLGYTGKAPRFATAFKFPAAQVTTVITGISLQVGRTGVVTPVAELQPVTVAGSTVARATLHNEDEIRRLDVRVGDTVVIQKAGDIIPDVVQVLKELRPSTAKPFVFPRSLPGIGALERIPGQVAYRIKNKNTLAQQRRRFQYFASQPAFNIPGLGPKQIDLLLKNNLIATFADIFRLTEADLLVLPRFAEKSAAKLIQAINQRRKITLAGFITALSINQVGEETAKDLAGHFGVLAELMKAKQAELAEINGVGEVVAAAIVEFFADQDNQKMISDLLKEVTIGKVIKKPAGKLTGRIFVFTGGLKNLSRAEAKKKIEDLGGVVTDSVSKNTTYVVTGDKPGSKSSQARELGVTILTEAGFLKLIKE